MSTNFSALNKTKVFVEYYRPLLQKFLNPLSIIHSMPCLNSEGE